MEKIGDGRANDLAIQSSARLTLEVQRTISMMQAMTLIGQGCKLIAEKRICPLGHHYVAMGLGIEILEPYI